MADWLSMRPRFANLLQVSTLLWGVAAVTAIGSVATGMMHGAEGGFDAGNLDSHRFYAILTAVGSTVVWVLRLKGGPAVIGLAKAVGIVTFITMLLTVHFGSRVTHGERFLSVSVTTHSPASLAAARSE